MITSDPNANTAEATVEYYRVVVPCDCSSELLNAAKAFAVSITEQTGIEAAVAYDNEIDGRDILVTEVILGDTDRDISSFLLKDLRENDYICSLVDRTIIIGGKTEKATLLALKRFCSELLPKATSLYLMDPDDGFVHRAEYDEPSFTLNAFDINEYSIVYSASDGERVRALANKLQSLILENSGCRLELRSDLSYHGKRIELSLSSEGIQGNAAYLIPQEKNVILRAKDSFGLSVAIKELIGYLSDSDGGFSLSSAIECPYGDPTYTIASVERKGLFPLSSVTDTNFLTKTVFEDASPDAVFLRGMTQNDEWILNESPAYTCEYESSGENSLACCAKSGSPELLEIFVHESSTLLTFVYEINLGNNSFLLVLIDGELSSSCEVKLSEIENSSCLPMVVMIHTLSDSNEECSVTLDDADQMKIMGDEYSANGYSYEFSCYANKNVFDVSANGADDERGYRCISLERLSVFD